MWHLFAEELIDERSATSTQAFSKGYEYGKNEDKAIHELTLQAFKDEIERLKIYKNADIERVLVNPRDVISEKNGKILIGYQSITEQEAEIVKNEAEQFTKTMLYRILHETTKQKAVEKGMLFAQNFEEMIGSRAMLDCLEIQRKILNICLTLRVKLKEFA